MCIVCTLAVLYCSLLFDAEQVGCTMLGALLWHHNSIDSALFKNLLGLFEHTKRFITIRFYFASYKIFERLANAAEAALNQPNKLKHSALNLDHSNFFAIDA